MEQVIFEGRTGDHPVRITEENGLRSLRFGTEERQSCIDLFQPQVLQLAYTRWMVTALVLHPHPEHFLLVGLGGGALVHFLFHHFPEARITVVEKERLVIELAHGYFRLPMTRGLRIQHQDALTFGQIEPAGGYHVAFLDIFGAGAMAPAVFEARLYRQLLQQLEAEGILAVNLWSGDRQLYRQALEAAHEASEGRMLCMQVKKRSNVILLLFPGEIPQKRIKAVRKQSIGLQQQYGLEFPLFLKRLRRTNRSPILRTLFG
jgi:spermidine synthase